MGFIHYRHQPGDTRDAVKGGIGFLADSVGSSKTIRFCLCVATVTALILATTKEEQRLAPASEVLMGTPGTGLLGGTLQYLLDPHRQLRETQNGERSGN